VEYNHNFRHPHLVRVFPVLTHLVQYCGEYILANFLISRSERCDAPLKLPRKANSELMLHTVFSPLTVLVALGGCYLGYRLLFARSRREYDGQLVSLKSVCTQHRIETHSYPQVQDTSSFRWLREVWGKGRNSIEWPFSNSYQCHFGALERDHPSTRPLTPSRPIPSITVPLFVSYSHPLWLGIHVDTAGEYYFHEFLHPEDHIDLQVYEREDPLHWQRKTIR
jgi:hypothetical protein